MMQNSDNEFYKKLDKLISNDNFENIINNISDFSILFKLKEGIEKEKESTLKNKEFPSNLTEVDKIGIYLSRMNLINNRLKILQKRLNELQSLGALDINLFLNTLNVDKLSKFSSSDIICIAKKLDRHSLYLFINKLKDLKVPYTFEENYPDFLEKDLEILEEYKKNNFPPAELPDDIEKSLKNFETKPKSPTNSNESNKHNISTKKVLKFIKSLFEVDDNINNIKDFDDEER